MTDILVVDDDRDFFQLIQRLLAATGQDFKVSHAYDGEEGLVMMQAQQPDLVLLDMIMPGMSGGETYDIIKVMNPDIKVILASGYNVDGQATEILERGCNTFIQKPFGRKELSQKIRDVLRKSKYLPA